MIAKITQRWKNWRLRWAEYYKLCRECDKAMQNYLSSCFKITAVSNAGTDDKNVDAVCICRYYFPPRIGEPMEMSPFVSIYCKNYSGIVPCANKQCKHMSANNHAVKCFNDYNVLLEKKQNFWKKQNQK